VARVQTGDVQRAWDALFDALLAEHEEISRRVREVLQAELPAYRSLPLAALDADVRIEVERVLGSARAGRSAVSEQEFAELVAVGEARAQQGVPVDDMLRAWRIGVQVVVSQAREVGKRLGVSSEQVLEFVESTLAWADVAMVTTASAHRRAELELALADQERRVAFVRDALFGALAPAELRIQAEAHSLDPARDYVAVRARPSADGTMRELERALGFHEAAQHRRGLSALVDGDLAGFLCEAPRAEVDGVVGVGPPRPLERLAESYRLAARALVAAHACGMTGVHDVPSLGLRAAVAADADVGDALRAHYLAPLTSELAETLRAYLACEMHVERTAERLFVHQNTVRYRLARFEELTGANLRDPKVAFEVWWALEREAMRL
jgi:hypothetical protein